MRVAARRGRWVFGLALVVAACESGSGAATGPAPALDPAAEVAVLAVVEGRVTVRKADGAEVEARPEMRLTRADTVVTTPGALAVVLLANGHVLKLEEDQATPVRALAHLDDPPPRETVAELFERALGAEAFARVGGAERIERIAGWNARRASGETPAPLPARPSAPPARADSASEEVAAPSPSGAASPIGQEPSIGVPATDDDASAQLDAEQPAQSEKKKASTSTSPPPSRRTQTSKDSAQRESPPPEPIGQSAPSPAPGRGPAAEESGGAVDLADSWIFETGPKDQVTRTSLPAPLKAQRKALARCVVDAQPGVAAPELRLQVVGGVVQQVTLAGGAAAPACARGLLGQALAGVGDGWVIVRVRR